MKVESLPTYSVKELNEALGLLISRGFAPRFLLHATVSSCRLKKGHLWLSLTDGESTIDGVIWSSQLKLVKYKPSQDDGVLIIGKINFWQSQARLNVQVIDIRPSESTVLKKFKIVSEKLIKEGIIAVENHRTLPKYPNKIAILTSIPSSALADILRTAKERWPLTKLLLISIPVQGDTSREIKLILENLYNNCKKLEISAIVIARGGGNREDLMVFDDEEICRTLAQSPIPIITGIGHEDDVTVSDLVADHRSATPTAAIVDLLPSKINAKDNCNNLNQRIVDLVNWYSKRERLKLMERKNNIDLLSPKNFINKFRERLNQTNLLLKACSPEKLLERGFCLVTNKKGKPIKSIYEVSTDENILIEFQDGRIESEIINIETSNERNLLS